MINVAILGFGVVGTGVAEIIRENSEGINKRAGQEISLKYILDIRDLSSHPEARIITKNPEDIFNDNDVNIIVETIGGIGAAYEFTKKALMSGKHVVTSNKELIATYGSELLQIAKEKNVHYLFEASVGGGIPVIRPIYECLEADEITSIIGILNGTTNYILTHMAREKKDFAAALKDAKAKGYAEAHADDDIEGLDSCRKIAILSSIAYGGFVNYKEIPTQGISNITYDDLQAAEMINSKIKLLAYSKKTDGKIFAKVCPVMVNNSHVLANVNDVFNAVIVKGKFAGDIMFYGRGAGKLPTASAVVGDIINIVKNFDKGNRHVWSQRGIIDLDEGEVIYFARVKVNNRKEAGKVITKNFGGRELIEIPDFENQLGFKTKAGLERDIISKIDVLKKEDSISEVLNTIRVIE